MAKAVRQKQALAQTFKVLSDPTRLGILMELRNAERNVTQLYKKLKVAQPTLSHHLSILRMGKLVETRRDGKEIYYSLAARGKDTIGKVLSVILD